MNTARTGFASRKNRSLSSRLTEAGDKLAFNWGIREGLYKHLSSQNANGVSIESALEGFRPRLLRRKKISSDKIVGSVIRSMTNGSTLADALGRWIPPDEFSVISSGELSGKLSKTLDLIIETKRRIGKVVTAVRGAFINPIIYLIAIYLMLYTIGSEVIPKLTNILPVEKVNGIVWLLYKSGDFANSWYIVLPPIFVIAILILIIRSFPRWTGKSRIIAERYFPYSFYRDMNGFTWLMGFSSLLRAGMSDVEILERQLARATPWMRERLQALYTRMKNGASLDEALLMPGKNGLPAFHFPNPDIIDDISSMASFPDFPEKISAIATIWAIELEEKTLAKAKWFGLCVEIFMYLVMGILLSAISVMTTQLGTPGV